MAPAQQLAVPPRVMVAGLAGDSGKSLVALGLTRALDARGHRVAAFKKGPDFIDAAWLGAAARGPGRNLDTFLMPPEAILASAAGASARTDVLVVEGNRGLFDGFDAAGSHSTATLAKLLRMPTVLVVDTTKATRTVAALVLGCRALDPDVNLAGVILNRVGTARQERVIREALAVDTDVPVLGAIGRLPEQHLPSRHLGLVTAFEHPDTQQTLDQLGRLVEESVDVGRVLELSHSAPPLQADRRGAAAPMPGKPVRIGVLRDRAFTFYYPENLEALREAGAELVFLSPLHDRDVPELDALYAGGGFPEVHARELAANAQFRRALARRIDEGIAVWAECGGLGYLARTLIQDGTPYPMVGTLPVVVEQTARPQGHGYVVAQVDGDNPFFAPGTELRGHEFHYSRVLGDSPLPATMLAVDRGEGLGHGRDGIIDGNVVATYTHLHALGAPSWAAALVQAARSPRQPRARTTRAGSSTATAKRPKPPGANGLKGSLRQAVEAGDIPLLQQLVAEHAPAVRHLLRLSYHHDPGLRAGAARGLALASDHQPAAVQKAVERLVWAMDERSGTNARTAPDVLQAIANERPALLLPVVPDLLSLAATDPGLREGLATTLRTVARGCPGHVGKNLHELVMESACSGGCDGGQA